MSEKDNYTGGNERCDHHPAALVQPHENTIKNALGRGRCGFCGAEVDLTRRSSVTDNED